MIMDLVDPLESGPARMLYTEEYYGIAKGRLNPGGVLVTQSGPAGLLSFHECFTTIYRTLGEVFQHTMALQAHVPAFQTMWGFSLASDNAFPDAAVSAIDEQVSLRIAKELKFYDGETHRSMTALPKFLRAGIREERRINRDANPVFMGLAQTASTRPLQAETHPAIFHQDAKISSTAALNPSTVADETMLPSPKFPACSYSPSFNSNTATVRVSGSISQYSVTPCKA